MRRRKNEETQLEELLRQRAEIDARAARYKREFAVLFADISGSTRFYDQRGDLSGVMMVQGFVDRATPSVTRCRGRIVKTIGDAILAYFEEAAAAVEAAMGLQKEFAAFNATRAPADRIELRIGVNYGTGFLWRNDVFGDVVNVAARLEGLAQPNQIVISAEVAPAVQAAGHELVPLGPVKLRGKSTTQQVFEIRWKPEAPADSSTQYSVVLLDAGGAAAAEYLLERTETILGRRQGDIRFPRDPLLAARHACFRCEPAGLRVEDLSSTGVFLRLTQPLSLKPGDVFLLGRQLLAFETRPAAPALGTLEDWGAAVLAGRQRFPLARKVTVLGRTRGTLTFPSDSLLSAAHARICFEEDAFYLEDLGSTNGTFLKIRGSALLRPGDTLLCGSQLLRVRWRVRGRPMR